MAKEIPDSVAKVGKDLASHSINLDKRIAGFIEELDQINDISKIKNRSVWMMKQLLRAAMEIVMEREQAYSRDLYPSYKLFSKYYPAHAKDAEKALDLVLNPISEKKKIKRLVNNLGNFIASESTRIFR